METKEARVKKITALYYSNTKVQEAILKFAKDREVVPRYLEAFGKRPDVLIYPSDISGLVKRGATSFHASEEIWHDPLKINSDMKPHEMNELRREWDLVIDIDSEYLDLSSVLALLVIEALERHGVKNYGIKFSGNKGWHILVSGKAFPDEFESVKKNEGFPEWPRAICEYLMNFVKKDYNRKAGEVMGSIEKIEARTELSKDEFVESNCPVCGRAAKKGEIVEMYCDECGFSIQRKDMKLTKRKLICPQNGCPGKLELKEKKDYFECSYCSGVSSINKRETTGKYKATFTKEAVQGEEFEEEVSGAKFGASDLVLVSTRHLFRMPYSLHEKTALASVVVDKNEINGFDPVRDANPLRVKIRDFMPLNDSGEGIRLLRNAMEWKKERMEESGENEKRKYGEYKEIDLKGVDERMFPPAIKKLLNGLKEGRKRGLFVLITFLRSVGFSAEYVNNKIREWNNKNEPPLKEGYVKSQIEWHLKQKRKILPPNYSNDSFYRDLGLIDEKPKAKNPIVEVMREVRRNE